MEPVFWPAFISLMTSPWLPIIAGTGYLLVYLYLTDLFYQANRRKRVTGLLRRNGRLDYAGIFSLLEWHHPGSLRGVHSGTWRSELQCLVISLQTMTTLGYTRSAPNSAVAKLVACAEAILRIFFIAVFISRWVNAL